MSENITKSQLQLKHGKITTLHVVKCLHCGKQHFDDEFRFDKFIRQIRTLGWADSKFGKWVCPGCISQPRLSCFSHQDTERHIND